MTGKGKFPNETCSKRLHFDWGHSTPCERPVTTHEDGKPWCTIHAPSYVAKKDKEWQARLDAKRAADQQKWAEEAKDKDHLALYPELVKALKAYQQANPLHNDSEAQLYNQAEAILAQAERIEKGE